MNKRTMLLITAALPLVGLIPLGSSATARPQAPGTATHSAKPPPSCAPVPVTAPPGAKVESVKAVHRAGGTVTFPATPFTKEVTITGVPAYCEITVTLTHRGANDHVKTAVTLPDRGWTGRLQAVGGSAYTAGDFGAPLVQAVKDGYAGVTTDSGVPLTFLDTSWGLTSKGKINQPLLTNFSTRSVHEAALIGKQVAKKFYSKPVSYAYWNGCSTGGRQGYSEAQRYPMDFDGILANAPAVQWSQFAVATLWPQVVMNQEHNFVSNCVQTAFRQAAIAACDRKDGVTNGIIDRPDRCGYDPRTLVGRTVECEGEKFTVTAADAKVMRKIWDGPTDRHGHKLWAGLPKGADPQPLAGTTTDETTGQTSAPGFPVATGWVQTFLKKRPGFDTSTLSYQQFDNLFRQSVREYDKGIGTSNPDLRKFQRSGGKLLTYVGTSDQLIPPGGTLAYRHKVERKLGGTSRVNSFYRLFLAPGVQHCGGGVGPTPTDPLSALVTWVEKGKAPATLPASTLEDAPVKLSRNLCPLPQESRYQGHGDPRIASSFRCSSR